MKATLTLAALTLGLLVATPMAQAYPGALALSVLPSPHIEQVAGRCGPRAHRDRYGRCRPNRPNRAPRRAYRGCPEGYQMTQYGCRRPY